MYESGRGARKEGETPNWHICGALLQLFTTLPLHKESDLNATEKLNLLDKTTNSLIRTLLPESLERYDHQNLNMETQWKASVFGSELPLCAEICASLSKKISKHTLTYYAKSSWPCIVHKKSLCIRTVIIPLFSVLFFFWLWPKCITVAKIMLSQAHTPYTLRNIRRKSTVMSEM